MIFLKIIEDKPCDVSVIVSINNKNDLKNLNRALASCAKQDYKDIEIVLMVSNLDINKIKIFNINYECKEKLRIKYIDNSNNINHKKAFYNTLSKCSGYFVTFLNPNDVLENNAIRILLNMTMLSDVNISFSNFNKGVNRLPKYDEINLNNNPDSLILIDNSLYGKLFNKELMLKFISSSVGINSLLYPMIASEEIIACTKENLYTKNKLQFKDNVTSFYFKCFGLIDDLHCMQNIFFTRNPNISPLTSIIIQNESLIFMEKIIKSTCLSKEEKEQLITALAHNLNKNFQEWDIVKKRCDKGFVDNLLMKRIAKKIIK